MDDRFSALDAWLRARLAGEPFRVERASTDASFRRYFRVFLGGRTLIAMDAPPEREDSRAFVKVAGLLRDAGLNAPRILEHDFEQGFLLVTDLGTRLYLQALQESDPTPLFAQAATALVRWQASTREGALPEYDEPMLRREISLFPDWYVARHLGVNLSDAQRESLGRVFDAILSRNLAEPRVFVHRDFMPRNLMVSAAPALGVLDFQDAVYGPITYDIASLMRDAFLSWDEEFVLDITIRYWTAARKAGLPVDEDFGAFYRAVEWMGLQRHLKVAGIFARLTLRDGKPRYLADTPRFIAYIRSTASRYMELTPLLRVIDEVEGTSALTGFAYGRV
jgi:aminoglycoside/choline kinase family phosphotransferase